MLSSSVSQRSNFSGLNNFQGQKLFPSHKLEGDQLVQVLNKIKDDMKTKNINAVEAFRQLDANSCGLLSFGTFSREIDKISTLS